MGMGEVFQRVDSEFSVSKGNRHELQIAERGRQRIHIAKVIESHPSKKDIEAKFHIHQRRIRKRKIKRKKLI